MSFKDRPFSERFEKLGDEAEAVFESVYPNNFVRYGLNRPNIQLARVPAVVRYTPDYLTAKGLVEVQGFGRDQTFKIKCDKLAALDDWNCWFRVDLFVWDSWSNRYGWVRLEDLIRDEHYTLDSFPEGKKFMAWEAKWLPVIEWHQFDGGALPVQS